MKVQRRRQQRQRQRMVSAAHSMMLALLIVSCCCSLLHPVEAASTSLPLRPLLFGFVQHFVVVDDEDDVAVAVSTLGFGWGEQEIS